ncbi:endosialidase [Parasporobacterium paucivorans]|uniref:Endosialidase n=1 Tax=Parasporobacterium paucivorans DSM 15970 TaxID=1122934 RepID=A0A1M6HH50_9FIRM|nr:endosialidase [Parasporobacterium paucivorans]SHJ21512.1 hypothetical protein SAMN02745691_01532 [Parasporobacterium paucivorans DSM 15970]
MSVVKGLIQSEDNGTISFGDYNLEEKSKLSDFGHKGDLYKVKTFKEITKLEKNGSFVYESVPGTAVNDFEITDEGMSFKVEGTGDAQITVELEGDTEYTVFIDDMNAGKMKTNLAGKLMFSVELDNNEPSPVKIVKNQL